MHQPSSDAPSPSADRRPITRVASAVVAVAVLLTVAACGSAGGTPAPPPTTISPSSGSPGPSAALPSPSPSESAAMTPEPTSSRVSQTETAWGEIWDAVPASIPAYPGAQPGQTGTGPYSGSLVVPGSNVETVTAWYKASLDRLGYSTVVEPPLEDGSRVLDSTGSDHGCKVQTRVAKQGIDTTIAILYGASCPFR